MKKRYAMTKAAAVVTLLGLVLVAAACSTQRNKDTSGEEVDTLNMTQQSGQPTFTRNFNPFSPASKKAPGLNFFYEPLVRVDQTDSNKVKPWLAKKFSYSNHGKTLTFKLRKDVEFSDGEPLTAEDVKYTLELPSKKKGLGAAPIPNLKKVSTPDKHTAVVHYSKPQLHDLVNYGDDPRLIVPAHIWKEQNAKKWTNKSPVGTGAFTLTDFGTQNIKLKVRRKYWHGEFHGVKYVNIRAYGSGSASQQMILKNQVSWIGNAWQNYKEDFVEKDPKNNHYWAYPTGGSDGILFNAQQPPTNDKHIRRALYAALNSKSLIKLYDTGSTSANPTGLNAAVWSDYLPEKIRNAQHDQDTEKARAELKASSYKVKNGKLVKDGKAYPLSLKTNSSYSDWSAIAPGLKRQWKKVLGLDVRIKKSPSDQLSEYQANGDFQMLYSFLADGRDIWSSLSGQLDSDYIKPVGDKATGNYGRYKNAKIDQSLDQMATSRDPDTLKKSVASIADEVVHQVPYAPILNHDQFVAVNSTDWTGFPEPEEANYVPYTLTTVDNVLTIQHLRPNASK